MNSYSVQPSATRQAAGFVITGIVISLTAGVNFIIVGALAGRPIDGWTPVNFISGVLIATLFAIPFVFAGQAIFGVPALIIARRNALLIHPAISGAIGCSMGAVAAGFLITPLMGRDNIDVAFIVLIGAASGFVGGMAWWYLVEQYFVWNWDV